MTIDLAGFAVHLVRKPIKNLHVRIDQQGDVRISAPMRCPVQYIEQFLQRKQAWIIAHQARLRQLRDAVDSMPSVEQQAFLGQSYAVVMHEHATHTAVVLEGKQLCCYVQQAASVALKQALLTQWQRQQMAALLPDVLAKWQVIIGVQINDWCIRAMKTRWGSCHTIKKRICLNLYLIEKPLVCLEYVVVHELVHLLEPSHNQHFYALMSQFMPEWRQHNKLLKQYGPPANVVKEIV